jgi:hypothetical protein
MGILAPMGKLAPRGKLATMGKLAPRGKLAPIGELLSLGDCSFSHRDEHSGLCMYCLEEWRCKVNFAPRSKFCPSG